MNRLSTRCFLFSSNTKLTRATSAQEESHVSFYLPRSSGQLDTSSDRTAVMYLGKLVELGAAKTIYDEPLMPYTKH
jgi:ABC-type dipeptide/oligopeptide/nickel transport system ATPase component